MPHGRLDLYQCSLTVYLVNYFGVIIVSYEGFINLFVPHIPEKSLLQAHKHMSDF